MVGIGIKQGITDYHWLKHIFCSLFNRSTNYTDIIVELILKTTQLFVMATPINGTVERYVKT